ncbi:MAG: RecX family transcriptional regulator [Fimbriimonadales bacterium]|nr:RecX family transcriptional regulator [Fimbriimonadales bacterium]
MKKNKKPHPAGENAEQYTLKILLHRLRYRDAFEEELRHHAFLKQCPPHAIDHALYILRKKKILNDSRLAQHLAEIWTETKFWAPARIARELRARGAPEEAVEHALSLLPQEHLTAKKLLQKLKKLPPATLARRLASYGYSEECIEDVLPHLSD